MSDNKIGFIGAGQMAQAIARGITQHQLIPGGQIYFSDPSHFAVEAFQSAVVGSKSVSNNRELIERCDTIILAVKPQYFSVVAEDFEASMDGTKLLISIIAGITLGTLSKTLQTSRIVRVMPNTPCLIASGASGFTPMDGVEAEDLVLVDQVFSSLGTIIQVEERLLDAVTGLSGSGPAYVLTFIQALVDGGVLMGLPRKTAQLLAVDTVIGAARLVRETGVHPAELYDRVTSPGGTTIHGIQALEENGFRHAVISAVEAATLRSEEMAILSEANND